MAAAQNKMSNPLFTIPELIESYKEEIGLDINLDHFRNPNAHVWFGDIRFIISKVLEIPLPELEATLRALPHPVEHTFLYESSIMNMRTISTAKCIFNDINATGLRDFNILDITRPTKKKLIQVLSAFLNFLRFKQTQKNDIDEIIMKEKVELDKNAMLKEKGRVLEQQIMELTVEKNDHESRIVKMKAQCQNSAEVLRERMSKFETLSGRCTKLEEEKTSLADVLKRKQEAFDGLKERYKNAQKKIVHSPMRLQHDIQLHAAEQQDLLKEFEEQKAEYRVLRERAKALIEAKEEFVKLRVITNAVEANVAIIKEKRQTLAKRETECRELRAQSERLKPKLAELVAENSKKREALADADDQHENKMKISRTKLEGVVRRNIETIAMIETRRKEVAALQEKKETVDKEIDDEATIALEVFDNKHKAILESLDVIRKTHLDKTSDDIQKEVEEWFKENNSE